MLYSTLKFTHLVFISLNLSLFLLRASWMWRQSPPPATRWLKILPHLIDTLLLLSGVSLLLLLQQYPFREAWLSAKFFALLAYVICGSMALKHGHTLTMRRRAVIAALLCFAYLVMIALTHQANPYYWRI